MQMYANELKETNELIMNYNANTYTQPLVVEAANQKKHIFNQHSTPIATMKKLIFISGFVFFAFSVTAQMNNDSLRLQYKQKTLRLGYRITMNGFAVEKTTVQNLMLLSPEATGYYKKYLKSRTVGNTLPLIGTAAVIGGILIAQKNRTPGNVIIISGNTINLVASLFRRKASIHLQDAIWTYNRDVLYPQQ